MSLPQVHGHHWHHKTETAHRPMFSSKSRSNLHYLALWCFITTVFVPSLPKWPATAQILGQPIWTFLFHDSYIFAAQWSQCWSIDPPQVSRHCSACGNEWSIKPNFLHPWVLSHPYCFAFARPLYDELPSKYNQLEAVPELSALIAILIGWFGLSTHLPLLFWHGTLICWFRSSYVFLLLVWFGL